MLPAQVNNQGYKQPQASEESAAPTQCDKQIHWKDIANVRVVPQGESERDEDKTCSSHTPTHVPWDHQALLSQLIKLLFPCHSLQALSCFWDWNWLKGSKKASKRAGAKQGQHRAMGGTNPLSWCYMNTMPTCSRRKPSPQTSTGSVQSRQNCQQHSACGTSNLFRNWTQLVFPQPSMFADLPPRDFPHRAVPVCTPTVFWTWSTQFT